MRLTLLFTLCLFLSITSYAQDFNRIEINGKIVVNSDDLEGVTVFNMSSNKGTLTDENGKFTLKVALNDMIEFRALQFQEFTVTVDKNIMTSKKMTVFLVEKINKLPEIVLLPYDLTGNLVVDMESVRTFNPDLDAIYFGVNDINTYEFPDDYHSEVDNTAMPGTGQDIRYGLNVNNIVGLLLKPLFKSKKSNAADQKVTSIPTSSLQDYYSARFIEDNFNIPKDKVDEFIVYVETQDLDYSLLKKGKEMEFLEYLTLKSQQFLKLQGE